MALCCVFNISQPLLQESYKLMRFSKKYEKPRKKGGSVRYKTPDEAGAVNLNKDKPWVSLFRDIEITSFFCYNIYQFRMTLIHSSAQWIITGPATAGTSPAVSMIL